MVQNDEEDWKTSDLNVDSLWLFDSRDKSGKHENIYHGNFIPQIPYQLIKRYTKKDDTVLELFTGSGTTLFECEKLKRNYIGSDINEEIIDYVNSKMIDCNSIKYRINNCDVTDEKKFSKAIEDSLENNIKKNYVDFIIAHPPYLDIVKFTDKKEDLSNISDINVFLEKIISAFSTSLKFLSKGKYFSVVIGDLYRNSEVIPLGFYVMNRIKQSFKVKLKGIIVKNIEGNRGKLGIGGIWKYRALKSDYFLFKHEYIFVFKKEF